MELNPISQTQFETMAADHDLWLASGRKEGKRADFSDCSLRDCDFAGKNLKEACFRGADLSGMMINDVNLDECDFTRVNLSGSSLERVSALNAQFAEANLHRLNQCSPGNRHVSMAGSKFEKARLTELFLHSFDLSGTRFSECKMDSARLIYCRLAGAGFRNCSMPGSDFRFAALQGADFSGSDLTEAIFMENIPESIIWTGANLKDMRRMPGDIPSSEPGLDVDYGEKPPVGGERQKVVS